MQLTLSIDMAYNRSSMETAYSLPIRGDLCSIAFVFTCWHLFFSSFALCSTGPTRNLYGLRNLHFSMLPSSATSFFSFHLDSSLWSLASMPVSWAATLSSFKWIELGHWHRIGRIHETLLVIIGSEALEPSYRHLSSEPACHLTKSLVNL